MDLIEQLNIRRVADISKESGFPSHLILDLTKNQIADQRVAYLESVVISKKTPTLHHYHQGMIELFLIHSGEAHGQFEDIVSKETIELIIPQGYTFTVPIGVSHGFTAKEYANLLSLGFILSSHWGTDIHPYEPTTKTTPVTLEPI